jgi:hypothetical protein
MKASQLITIGDVGAVFGPPPFPHQVSCLGTGIQLDAIVNPDGTRGTKFQIPRGKVLIITDYEYEISSLNGLNNAQVAAQIEASTGATLAAAPSCDPGQFTCSGAASGLMVVVKPNALPICLAPNVTGSFALTGMLHGFLATDK